MSEPLRLAVVGVGRIGVFHARHVQELARETGACELAAVVDTYEDTAERVARQLQEQQSTPIHVFASTPDLVAADLCDAAIIASRTEDHYPDAKALIDVGQRVLLEKPLTHTLESARAFVGELRGDKRRALMQAFMRRFDPALICAREWLSNGRIGEPFKIVSVLEDPGPPPAGYSSPGILPDMSVHNVDEVLWLTGTRPTAVLSMGSRLFGHKQSPVDEDFDDAFVQMWFDKDLLGQIQVSRNHVAGYRNETWIYGENGLIHVGPFDADGHSVRVETYDAKGHGETRVIRLRNYGPGVPGFIERFGAAYKSEVAYFVEQCRNDQPFSVDQIDALTALEVVDAAQRSVCSAQAATRVDYDA